MLTLFGYLVVLNFVVGVFTFDPYSWTLLVFAVILWYSVCRFNDTENRRYNDYYNPVNIHTEKNTVKMPKWMAGQ